MIELKNVNFQYNTEEASGGLHEINLVIPNGEVVLLCGQSGCGKTTLTRLIKKERGIIVYLFLLFFDNK